MEKYDVIIIGAGTAGLSARKEVAKKTDNYLVVHHGPIGTTCARVGCMPSKGLIQAANDYHQAKVLAEKGMIQNPGKPDLRAVMAHVRALRDRFVKGVVSDMAEWKDKLLIGEASFIDAQTLSVNGKNISAKKIIIATGSSPALPEEWKKYQRFFVDTDELFELREIPKNILVVGLGVIGLEMGQALAHLGVHVVAVNRENGMGGLTDPDIQKYVSEKIRKEFPVHKSVKFTGPQEGTEIFVELDGKIQKFDKVLICVGRKPNLKKLSLENAGVFLDERGIPEFSTSSLSVKDSPHLFIAGDVNAHRPVLHEAADDGKIAGYNSVNEAQCFKRRIFLSITFSAPNIAVIGKSHKMLSQGNVPFVTGAVTFEGQGRAIVKMKEQGLLHVYVSTEDGKILGAELQAPSGEHLAHLLAWAISLEMTVSEALKMPFYHPVVEEGLRTALRNAAKQLPEKMTGEMFYCEDAPIR